MSIEQSQGLEEAIRAGFEAIAEAVGGLLTGVEPTDAAPAADAFRAERSIGESTVSVSIGFEGERPDIDPAEIARIFLDAAAGAPGDQPMVGSDETWQGTIGDMVVTIHWTFVVATIADADDPAPPSPTRAGVPTELNRLAGVMLDVAVELGRTRVPIKDLLSLDQGGVIKLGKPLDEPVELVVNGLTTARGEMVVVDGRLGLKITELVD